MCISLTHNRKQTDNFVTCPEDHYRYTYGIVIFCSLPLYTKCDNLFVKLSNHQIDVTLLLRLQAYKLWPSIEACQLHYVVVVTREDGLG